MKAYIREKMLEAIVEAEKLIHLYQIMDGNFLPNTVNWLSGLEAELSKLRHPLTAMLTSERGKVVAAMNGQFPPHVEVGRSKRKAVLYQAVQSINVVDENLRNAIDQIDQTFSAWKDKIAQLAALTSSKAPIELTDSNLSNTALKNIWKQFGANAETYNMHQYLAAAMPQADLLYLLHDVVSNLLSNSMAEQIAE